MKYLAAIILLFGAAVAIDYDQCHDSVVGACSATSTKDYVSCNSVLGGIEHAQADLQSYVNSQLASSYDYLLLATHFNSYQKNRPGFEKLLMGLSDKAWDKAVDLIKHLTKRGGEANFNQKHEAPSTISRTKKELEVDELHALAMALDSEKKLATDAHHMHRRVSHLDNHQHYDPELSQYIEEEFLEYQTDTIRKISGYTNDLAKLVKTADPSLSIYLFDEYLAKQ